MLVLLVATMALGVYHNMPSETSFQNNHGVSNILLDGVLGGMCAFFIWGLCFWPAVILTMGLLEYVVFRLIRMNKKVFWSVMMLETILICIPFIYFRFAYDHSEWYYFIGAFVLSQLIRIRKIQAKYALEFVKTYIG